MAKKKRNSEPEVPSEPGILDRVLANRWLTIGAGGMIVALFAGAGILIVTLLGGDDLSAPNALAVPDPIGPPPAIERSAAADLLNGKTWDDMNADDRALVEAEVKRVFDDSTFRAKSSFVLAIDVYRRNGFTQVSRQYQAVPTATDKQGLGEQIIFDCGVEEDNFEPIRYILTPLQRELTRTVSSAYRPAWSTILSGTDWSEVTDLGYRTSKTGRRMRGLELKFKIDPSVKDGSPAQHWFDVETAQLLERGSVVEDDEESTQANWYYLSYDQLLPLVIPSDLEQPDCVKDILTKIGQ